MPPIKRPLILCINVKDDYEGVSAIMNDHLEVFSTGGFEVKVSTDGDFTRTGGETILATLKLKQPPREQALTTDI
jgi:hypothetical protein